MKNNQKGFVEIVLIVAVILLVGLSSYVAWKKSGPTYTVQGEDQRNALSFLVDHGNSGKVDTTNWKTYTNTEYVFEFQYPSGTRVEENNAVIKEFDVRDSQDNYLFSLQIFPLEKGETSEVWLKNYSEQMKIPYSVEAVKVNGYDAFRASSNSKVSDSFYFIENNNFIFSFDNFATDVDQILPTFKFTK